MLDTHVWAGMCGSTGIVSMSMNFSWHVTSPLVGLLAQYAQLSLNIRSELHGVCAFAIHVQVYGKRKGRDVFLMRSVTPRVCCLPDFKPPAEVKKTLESRSGEPDSTSPEHSSWRTLKICTTPLTNMATSSHKLKLWDIPVSNNGARCRCLSV